jgi:hypothetical protein
VSSAKQRYVGVHRDRQTGRVQARVQHGGKTYYAGRWRTEREAALARDRLVLHLGLDWALNLPREARGLGPASAAELARQAVQHHRDRVGRSAFIGLRRGKRKNWLAFVIEGRTHHHIGAFDDPQVLAVLRDRVARHLGVPKYSWNFPDRRLKPMSLEQAKAELRTLRNRASAYRGVYVSGERWLAAITLDHEQITLGSWATEEEAALAYDRAALFYRGDGPRNFPGKKLEPRSAAALRREARLQPRPGLSSRYRGVVAKHGRDASRPWQALVSVGGVPSFAGAWPTEKAAALAVDRAVRFYSDASEHDLNFPAEAHKYPPASIDELREQARAEYKQGTTSQYTGVHYRAGRYDAYLVHQRKRVWLGRFDTEEEAAVERDKAARKLHGKKAKLNFPDDE